MNPVYIFLFALFAFTKAQIPNIGFCPEYLPKADFDMEAFMGKWYEAERYFQFSGVASRCVVTDYARAPSGKIMVSNEVTNRLTGVKRIIGGNLELVGKNNEGKLNVKYGTTPLPTESTLIVLDTDYDNYAVVWSCNGFGPVHAQSAWLMTRERLPSGKTLQKAYGVLDQFKINRTFFVKTDQEGCSVAASDINAANGITATSTVPESTGSDQKKSLTKSSKSDVSVPAKVEDKPVEMKKDEIIPVAEVIMKNALKSMAEKATEEKRIEVSEIKTPSSIKTEIKAEVNAVKL